VNGLNVRELGRDKRGASWPVEVGFAGKALGDGRADLADELRASRSKPFGVPFNSHG
jgi:hypothetical protein